MAKHDRVTIHEEVVAEPQIPGLVDAMRGVLAAREKLDIATQRQADAREELAKAERARDSLTVAVEHGDVVGPGELRVAESAVRDAESYVMLLAKGVEAAQVVVRTAESAMAQARISECTRRNDAAAAVKQAAVAAWHRAHSVIEEATKAEAVQRYVGIPADELERHWELAQNA